MRKTAWIYPGQGAQMAGMGRDFYECSALARELYDEASEKLKIDLKALCFEKNELLDLTEYTQAALVTTCLAITRELKRRGGKADMTAGLSLGEYAAIAAAGGMSEIDAICLVRKRGLLMQNTVPAGEGSMSAVIGMEEGKIEKVLRSLKDVGIANYNCPGQIVISGKTSSVKEAGRRLKEAGARRIIPLSVSGPFHSIMLKSAGDKLRKELEMLSLNSLECPYVSNVDAGIVTEIETAPPLLARQVYSPVRWMQSVRTMLDAGVDTFVEIGPGKTLSGFMRKIAPDVTVLNLQTAEDMDSVCAFCIG